MRGPTAATVTRPKVSVLIRTYNHVPYIAQAIESVLLQQAPFSFEILIAEDCSSDGTRRVVREYAQRYPDLIRPLLPEENIGAPGIFRQAVEGTRGEYVAYLDGDDYWSSRHKLRKQVELLDAHPGWASCFHDVSLIYDQVGHPSGFVVPARRDRTFGLEHILQYCFIPPPSWIVRRPVLNRLPRWVVETQSTDWITHVCAAQQGALGYVGEVLAAYRVHAGGQFSGVDRSSQLEEDLRFYERLLRELVGHRKLIERCIVDRRCQLAVEESALPYDAPLLVVEPRGDMPLYFNGRHARYFPRPRAGGKAGGSSIAELKSAARELSVLPPPVPDYEPRAEPQRSTGDGKCYLVVPGTAFAWLAEESELRNAIEDGCPKMWSDDWCRIYELAVDRTRARDRKPSPVEQVGPLLEVLEVSRTEPLSSELRGAHLDGPKPGARVVAHAMYVTGWALGERSHVVAVEFELGEELVWRAILGTERPDLAEAFSDHPDAGRAGFSTTVNLTDAPPEFELTVHAVLGDERRVPIGTISGRRHWHEPARSRPLVAQRHDPS